MKPFKIFVDGDGTLVPFDKNKTLYDIAAPGYFAALTALGNMAEGIELLSHYAEIFLVSAVLPYEHIIPDKNKCYDVIVPCIPKDHRLYISYEDTKLQAIQRLGFSKSDIFIDDYSHNLHEVSELGLIPVKAMNDINGTHGTWHGASVNVFADSLAIADTILGLHLAAQFHQKGE